MQAHQDPSPKAWLRENARDFARMFLDGRFWFWAILLLAGYAYVAGVLCGRTSPIASSREGHHELAKLAATLPFLFFISTRHVLEPWQADWRRALAWNVAGYAAPFFVALHWLYLQRIPHINYSITWADLSSMHPVAYVVFGLAALVMASLTFFHFHLAHKEGVLGLYLLTFAGAIAVIAGISWFFRAEYNFHIHHYFLFGFFIPWARFKHPVSLICQALCAGVYVEGISEWSMAALWYPRP